MQTHVTLARRIRWTLAALATLTLALPTTAAAQLRVSVVDWVQGRPEIPHPALNGRTTMLQAIAEGGNCGGSYTYRWDINGDGDYDDANEQNRNSNANSFAGYFAPLGLDAQLPNAQGDRLFFPKVQVTCGNETATATMPVKVTVDKLCPNYPANENCTDDQSIGITRAVHANRAVDRALWWMFQRFSHRNNDGHGNNVHTCMYSNNQRMYGHGHALNAFLRRSHGHGEGRESDVYYRHVTLCGLNALLSTYNVINGTRFDDVNNRGINQHYIGYQNGVLGALSRYGYSTSSWVEPLASFGDPEYVAVAGPNNIRGRNLREIGQDLADGMLHCMSSDHGWFYNCQNGGGTHSDASTNGWSPEALRLLERKMGVETYQWAKNGQRNWLNRWCSNGNCIYHHGGYKLSGNALVGYGWVDDQQYNPNSNHGNHVRQLQNMQEGHHYWGLYYMYAMTKGLRSFVPEITYLPNGRDWSAQFNQFLLPQQAGDGSWNWAGHWPWAGHVDQSGRTAMSAQIVQSWLETQAWARATPAQSGPGIDITFDHSWSHVLDPSVHIVAYRWNVIDRPEDDRNGNGIIEDNEIVWDFETDDLNEKFVYAYDDELDWGEVISRKITLQVEDDNGLVVNDSAGVEVVLSLRNHVPVIVGHPDGGDAFYRGYLGTEIPLDGRNTYDVDTDHAVFPGDGNRQRGIPDRITSLHFDLNIDGDYDDDGEDGLNGPVVFVPQEGMAVGDRVAVPIRACDDGQWNGECYDGITRADCTECAYGSVAVEVVLNVEPPAIDAGGPYTGEDGVPTQLDLSGTRDPEGVLGLTYSYELVRGEGELLPTPGYPGGDGDWGPNPIYTPTGDGQRTDLIRATVTDYGDMSSEADVEIVIDNVPPTIEFWDVSYVGRTPTIQGGVTIENLGNGRYRASVNANPDPRWDAYLEYEASEPYGEPLTATADINGDGGNDGAAGRGDRGLVGPGVVNANAAHRATLRVSDGDDTVSEARDLTAPPADPTLRYFFDVGGDGRYEVAGGGSNWVEFQVPPGTDNVRIEGQVRGAGGAPATFEQDIALGNAAPQFEVARVLGQDNDNFAVVVSASAFDPDGDEVVYIIDWGDGSEPTRSLGGIADHDYPDGQHRAYTITITADDGRGGTARRQVAVDFPAPAENAEPEFELAQEINRDGFAVTLAASATDDDGDAISYTFDWGDGSPATESAGGVARHNFPEGQYREYTVTITADDGRGGTAQTQIAVDFPRPAANRAPVIEVVREVERDGFEVIVTASAADADGDALTYTFDWGDNSEDDQNAGGLASHAYPDGQFQTYTVTVTVDDGRGGTDQAELEVDFPRPAQNRAPTIESFREISREGFEVIVSANAIDPDGDTITYTFDWGDAAADDVQNGGLAGHGYADGVFRAYTITVTATDGRGGSDQAQLVVDFPPPDANRPPVLDAPEIISQRDFDVIVAASAIDPDGDALTYTFEWGDESDETVNAGGVAAHAYPEGQFRAYTITVTVQDGRGGQVSDEVVVDFPRPAANRAPEIEVVREITRDGFEVIVSATASDPDGDDITYTFDWGDESEGDTNNGGLAAHMYPEGQFEAYTVTVTATDGRGGSDQAQIEIDFPAPAENRPPAIDSFELLSQDGHDVVVAASALDPDGDQLTYTFMWADGRPNTVNAGGIAAHTYPEGVFRAYTVTVVAMDGRGGSAQAQLEVTFQPPAANQAPVIDDLSQISRDGFEVALAASALDPDGDALTFTFDWGDNSDDTVNVSGIASHVYPDGQFQAYTVTVTVDDGNGGTAQRQLEVDFPEPAANRPPVFDSLETISQDGFDVVLAASAIDPDGDLLTYTFVWGDGGPNAVNAGGVAAHTYPDGQFRDYTVTVTASDGRGGQVSDEIVVDFPAPAENRPPVIDSFAQIGQDGFEVVMSASAVDPDGDPITYAFDWGDGGPVTRNAGGVATHAYPNGVFRGYNVTVTATDGRGGEVSANLDIDFPAPAENRAPTVEQFVQIGRDGFEVVVSATATDPDNDALTYIIDWGDGSEPSELGAGLATHEYPQGRFDTYTAEVTVTDGRGGEASRQLEIDFPAPAANQDPVFAVLDELNRDGFRVVISASAIDPDGDALTYTFDWGDGEQSDSPTGVGVHEFPAGQFEAYTVTVTADDGRGGTAERQIEVDFPPPADNQPPNIELAREVGRDGFEVIVSATAIDPDGDAITYTFDWGDGEDPTSNAGGVADHAYPVGLFRAYTVTVTADDGRGGTDEAQFEVDFPAPAQNRAPTIEVAQEIGRDGFEVVVSASAIDPDGDAITYTFDWGDGTPDDQNAGGLATHGYAMGQFRAYTVTITADDGRGGRDSAEVEVDFPAPAQNIAPTIEIAREVSRDGFEIVASATAIDVDGDPITYTFDWGDESQPTSNAGGLAVHAYPMGMFETYTVTVTADDGRGGTDMAQFEVDFPAPAQNRAPSIEVARVLAIDGFEAVLTATAADPDGDAITYTFEWGDESEPTRNAGGVASHMYPMNMFRPYTVTVTADDGRGGMDQAQVEVDFPPPAENVDPVFEVARETSRDGFEVVITATAIDANGDELTYTFDWGDGSPVTQNAGGVAEHAYPVDEYREYTVTVTAEDGNGGTASRVVIVDFPPPDQNRPPVIEVARVLDQDGFDVVVTASAVDPDGDPITYAFEWGDDGLPTVNAAGLADHRYPEGVYQGYTVTITATDGRGGEAVAEVPVEFIAPDANRPPVFEVVREITRDGFEVTIAGSAVDPDGDTLTYTFNWGDGTPEVSNAGGIAGHPYAEGEFTTYTVTITADDSRGGTAEARIEVDFPAPNANTPPVIEEVRLVRQEGFEVLAVVGAVDADGDALTYTFDWGDNTPETVNRSGLSAHRYADDVYQQYRVNVTVDDGRGGTAEASADVVFEAPAENQPPEIRGVQLVMGPRGEAELQVDARDPENGPLTYAVHWGDEDDPEAVAAMFNGQEQHAYAYPGEAGPYVGWVEVTDDAGLTARAPFEAAVMDAPTEIRDLSPRQLRAATWFFDPVVSDADGLEGLRYSWDFEDDGVWDLVEQEQAEAVWLYEPPGRYTARLAVTDTWSGVTTEATVELGEDVEGNLPPRIREVFVDVFPGGFTEVFIDAIDPEGGQLSAEIAWGDEADIWFPLDTMNGTHTYAFPGDGLPYAGQVRVSDALGAWADAPFEAVIVDSPTEMVEMGHSDIGEGRVRVRATARDADSDGLVYSFDFDGDGEPDAQNVNGEAEHVYARGGDYEVEVAVTDPWSGFTTTFDHAFDLEPWVQAAPIPEAQLEGDEGQCLIFSIVGDELDTTKVDPTVCGRMENPDEDLWVWDFGDGSAARGSEVGHIYADDGRYRATVNGGDPLAPIEGKLLVSIINLPPSFITEPPELAEAGDTYSYVIELTDAGATDEIRLELNEGPEGMTLEPMEDRRWKLDWPVPVDANGDVIVELRATDGRMIDGEWVPDGGETIQRYILQLSGDIDPVYNPEPPPAEDPTFDAYSGTGCACDATEAPAGDALLMLLGVFGLGLLRRRRRR